MRKIWAVLSGVGTVRRTISRFEIHYGLPIHNFIHCKIIPPDNNYRGMPEGLPCFSRSANKLAEILSDEGFAMLSARTVAGLIY